MAAKTKRNVSGSALLRRKQFMEGATGPLEDAPSAQHATAPKETKPKTAAKPALEDAPAPPIADELQEDVEGVSKKQLQERYVAVKQDGLAADTIYFPHELYEVFREVWFARKKTKRGFKKSHIIIEALLRHPDVVEELHRRGLLK